MNGIIQDFSASFYVDAVGHNIRDGREVSYNPLYSLRNDLQ